MIPVSTASQARRRILQAVVFISCFMVQTVDSFSLSTLSKTKTNPPTPTAVDDPEWQFFDTARIHVAAGDGGKGCVAFRREKGEARGGPNGGRGGAGGNVYLVCDQGLNTLMPCRQQVHVRAKNGKNGQGKNKDGPHAKDIFVRVPPGTVVRDLKTQKLAGELREDGEQLLVAKGGRGGRGNSAFMTARRTAPKLAEFGEPGRY
jgi:GTP-binding protein